MFCNKFNNILFWALFPLSAAAQNDIGNVLTNQNGNFLNLNVSNAPVQTDINKDNPFVIHTSLNAPQSDANDDQGGQKLNMPQVNLPKMNIRNGLSFSGKNKWNFKLQKQLIRVNKKIKKTFHKRNHRDSSNASCFFLS